MKRRKELLSAGVLVALPLLLYAPFLFGGKVLYWGVYLLQFYPWRQLAVEQIRAGHWPLWNPYLGAGTPLAANLQTAAFYPPNLLFLAMPVERAFGWELALHVALAGLSAFYLGRRLGLGPFGALVTGLTYGLGGYVVAHWVFPSMVYAAAWLPLLLALTDRLISNVRDPILILDVELLALAIALQLLAGHAQTSFYSALMVASFALFRLGQEAGGRKQGLCSLLLAALWGLALAAIQLLPTAELAVHSQRAGILGDPRAAYELSFWPWRLITLLAPDFFGNPGRDGYWAYGTYWEEAAYVGVLPLVLAVLAVVRWWRRQKRREGGLLWVPFFLFLSLVSLLLALGNHTPLYPLFFHYLPGFGLFKAPARLMIGYALGMAVLAGIGADALRPTQHTRSLFRLAILVGAGMAVAGVTVRLALPKIQASFGHSVARLGLTLALSGAVLWLYDRRRPAHIWQLAACGLLFADLLAFGWGLAPGTDPEVYHNPVATAQFLQTQPPGRLFVAYPFAQEVYDRYVSLRAYGPTDLTYLQGLRESLFPNLNAVYHLSGVGNYDPLTVGRYQDLWDHLRAGSFEEIHPLLNLFGVRYIVSDEPLPLSVACDAGPRIYRNDEALPPAFVVPQARVVADPDERLAILLGPTFDPRAEVLLSRAPARPPTPVQEGGTPPAFPEPSVLRDGPNRVIIQVNVAQAGYLVLTDTWYPGWRATVDGEIAEILSADHAFRAVSLEAGEHTVVFEYAPLSFRVGAWVSLGAGVLWGAALTGGMLWRGRYGLMNGAGEGLPCVD
ncbi:MAG: YfhO family protein [Anaerolineae bacterium]